MRWPWRRPQKPRDVRLVHSDGTETPLPLEYMGIDHQGLHRWMASVDLRDEWGDYPPTLCLGTLPPMTGVTVKVIGPPPPEEWWEA